jgi:hypothetical protein
MSGYDIFEILNGGDVLWHKAASDLAEATKIAEEKAAQTKSSFFILDQSNQRKIHVTVEGSQMDRRVPKPQDSSASA